MGGVLLELEHLDAWFGDLQVLWGVSLVLVEGEVVALIGANGSGKSTIIRCVARLHTNMKGRISFRGSDLSKVRPDKLCALGISFVPEERGIFPQLTVEQNLLVGGYSVPSKAKTRESLSSVLQLFPILRERRRQPAGSLSGGEQQMLSIAKGLMTEPRLLILDEPSLGLAPVIVLRLMDLIQTIHSRGVSLLIVDQNIRKLLKISNRGYVLEHGRIVMEGSASLVMEDSRTRRALLGR